MYGILLSFTGKWIVSFASTVGRFLIASMQLIDSQQVRHRGHGIYCIDVPWAVTPEHSEGVTKGAEGF